MALPTWPFHNVHTSFNIAPKPNGRRVVKESGRPRQEKFDDNTWFTLSCHWEFLPEDYPFLNAWVKHKIDNGFGEFNITLPLNENQDQVVTAQAINGEWNATWSRSGTLWIVNADLEVDDSFIPTEAILDAYIAAL